ncbi:MAG: TRAP transporter small permease [Ideonella sp.]|nr:TRAP transporter small permease [Ideonella sp.]
MKRLVAATETVAAVFLLLIALVTAGNVALRDLFAVQIPDWFDGTKLLMGIALFWGIAVATYHAGHIAVDIVWEHLARRGRRVLDIIAGVITLAFLAPMAWMVFAKVLASGTQATTDLRLPLMWFTGIAAAGGVAGALLALARVVELLRGNDLDDGRNAKMADGA